MKEKRTGRYGRKFKSKSELKNKGNKQGKQQQKVMIEINYKIKRNLQGLGCLEKERDWENGKC